MSAESVCRMCRDEVSVSLERFAPVAAFFPAGATVGRFPFDDFSFAAFWTFAAHADNFALRFSGSRRFRTAGLCGGTEARRQGRRPRFRRYAHAAVAVVRKHLKDHFVDHLLKLVDKLAGAIFLLLDKT